MSQKNIVIVLIVIVLLGLGMMLSFNDDQNIRDDESSEQVMEEKNAISLNGQLPGSTIAVVSIVLDKRGFVVVHKEKDGKPAEIIGYSELLSNGEHSNVEVELGESTVEGMPYFAMLHFDNGDGVFFAGDDGPAVTRETKPVMMRFDVGNELKVLEEKTEMADEESVVKEFTLDAFKFGFSLKELRVKKGDKVKITLTNSDGLHDWAIDEFSAATERIGEGATATVEFVANTVGTFEYYCSVGNHRARGMVGSLIVEE